MRFPSTSLTSWRAVFMAILAFQLCSDVLAAPTPSPMTRIFGKSKNKDKGKGESGSPSNTVDDTLTSKPVEEVYRDGIISSHILLDEWKNMLGPTLSLAEEGYWPDGTIHEEKGKLGNRIDAETMKTLTQKYKAALDAITLSQKALEGDVKRSKDFLETNQRSEARGMLGELWEVWRDLSVHMANKNLPHKKFECNKFYMGLNSADEKDEAKRWLKQKASDIKKIAAKLGLPADANDDDGLNLGYGDPVGYGESGGTVLIADNYDYRGAGGSDSGFGGWHRENAPSGQQYGGWEQYHSHIDPRAHYHRPVLDSYNRHHMYQAGYESNNHLHTEEHFSA